MELPGTLITFEGIDGSGKSTQATMLFHRLLKEEYKALLVREPGGTAISEKIRDVLLDIRHEQMAPVTELLLYAASRAQLVEEKIKPNLEEGVIVICDRYSDSTLAYQGYGRGLNKGFIRNLNSLATQELIPDITYIIDVELDIADQRTDSDKSGDRLENEHQVFKRRVRNGYKEIANGAPGRIIMISGEKPVQELHEEIWQQTISKLQSNGKHKSYE